MPLSITSLRRMLVAFIAMLALAGFVATVLIALYRTIHEHQTPVFTSTYVFFANALAGLVGGIVAVGFGQSPPPSPNHENILQRNAGGLGVFLAPPELQSGSPQAGPVQQALPPPQPAANAAPGPV